MALFLVVCAIAALVWFVARPSSRRRGGTVRGVDDYSHAELRTHLTRLVHGDIKMVERLVGSEYRRAPHVNEDEALRRAITRLLNDRN